MSPARLVVDVGGTNVRFARSSGDGRLHLAKRFLVGDYPTFADALRAYLSSTGATAGLTGCAIAAAGPVDGGRVKLTNGAWLIDTSEAREQLGGIPAVIVNDLEAVALALPHLRADEVAGLGGPPVHRPEQRTMLAFNVGTGCGAAMSVLMDGQWRTCPSEAGHMTLAGTEPAHAGLIPDGASVETLFSGAGVVQLFARIAGTASAASERLDAAQIFARAGTDAAARKTAEVLSALLGRITGDLVLATAAWGGVFLTGSVATAWSRIGDRTQFRTNFEAKGAMTERMRQVPAAVIVREDVALFGLAHVSLAAGHTER